MNFFGVTSKISGIGLTGIEKKIRGIHKDAFKTTNTILPIGEFTDIEKMVRNISIREINSFITKFSFKFIYRNI